MPASECAHMLKPFAGGHCLVVKRVGQLGRAAVSWGRRAMMWL